MKYKSVFLDTSFLIRLLNDDDPLHKNAIGYYKYFLEHDIILKVSTIAIAEYCVRGKFEELPLRDIQIIPFNLDHAKRTGEFAKVLFDENNSAKEKLTPRAIIPNDSKLFAQADLDKSITHFVTSDALSQRALAALKKRAKPSFEIIDISTPYTQTYGMLEFE
jgi:predicted nucleic acid-binding protein